MPDLTTDFNSIHHGKNITFPNPYKKCAQCGGWVDGVRRRTRGQKEGLIPCGHLSKVKDVCPTWKPSSGCTCPEGTHELRS